MDVPVGIMELIDDDLNLDVLVLLDIILLKYKHVILNTSVYDVQCGPMWTS